MHPVEPPPGVVSTATSTVGQQPMLTTAGSPKPYALDRERFEMITIRRGTIAVRNSLPAINVPFRIRNDDTIPHVISLRSTSGRLLAADLTVPPRQGQILVVQLRKGEHHLICTVPTHNERASFVTYVPR